MRIGVFAGTFDPPSKGHLEIIEKASKLCDQLIVAVALKPEKQGRHLFSTEERVRLLEMALHGKPHISVRSFEGLIATFAKQNQASFLIRGLRSVSDFEHESQMALANRKLGGIETIFLLADETHCHISSSLIREIAFFGGPLSEFVPKEIERVILKKARESI